MTPTPFQYRVGILNSPVRITLPWTLENLQLLKDLGFNTMQLNIAWGWRPADEPLNLEDVIDLPEPYHHLRAYVYTANHPEGRLLWTRSDPARTAERRADLANRVRVCREAGMRSIFHFGAPNNNFYDPDVAATFGGQLARCLRDGKTEEYYIRLLEAFARCYPGVDDLLMYTYDQDAWLCNEFGTCPNCRGIPLHQRVTPFVNRMAETWASLSPGGRLWWEPWELSAGQVLRCVEQLNPACVGLAVHTNIAEAMVALPVDRWLKNTASLAQQRGIPVIVEGFLGAPSEEVEPFTHLSHPLVTLRMVRAISQVPGVCGIKEYYGLNPDKEDPNLRATALFLQNPAITDEDALAKLAEPYGRAAEGIQRFWRITSVAVELFPWDTSWFMREVGRSDISHSLSAALLRGYCAETPSWLSTRAAIFMKTDNREDHPWMLEDVQLRCEMTAERMAEAIRLGQALIAVIPPHIQGIFAENLKELDGFRRAARAYALHLRETNVATLMRKVIELGESIPPRYIEEMRTLLQQDRENQGQDEPVGEALSLLERDANAFLERYFQPEPVTIAKGYFSATSR